jgi:hypothetical protein
MTQAGPDPRHDSEIQFCNQATAKPHIRKPRLQDR